MWNTTFVTKSNEGGIVTVTILPNLLNVTLRVVVYGPENVIGIVIDVPIQYLF